MKEHSDTPVVVTPAPIIQQNVKPPRDMVRVSPAPPPPSAYAGKSAGLPPEALLRHATDYGKWCQGNAAKLRAL
ncbi:hypothetical protein ACSFCT_26170, partial [Yokenella regensburgei]|uniref:hypothetical protein n=1 Tax=Yokenella regensburgei TaxID=158877 RepID=UPI003EDA0D08